MSMILACQCDTHGAKHQVCDEDNGQCNCKNGKYGVRCDRTRNSNRYGKVAQLLKDANFLENMMEYQKEIEEKRKKQD